MYVATCSCGGEDWTLFVLFLCECSGDYTCNSKEMIGQSHNYHLICLYLICSDILLIHFIREMTLK